MGSYLLPFALSVLTLPQRIRCNFCGTSIRFRGKSRQGESSIIAGGGVSAYVGSEAASRPVTGAARGKVSPQVPQADDSLSLAQDY